MENQKCIVVPCIHHQISQDYPRYVAFSRIPKPALIIISKKLWKFLERQLVKSKVCTKKTQLTKLKQKTKKLKLRLKRLIGMQFIYLLDMLGKSSKSSCATSCHFKKTKFPFTKTSRWKFLMLS